MTDQTPTTEAGRRALYLVNNDRGLDAADILAIEAQARTEGLDVIDAAKKMREARERKSMAGPELRQAIVAEQRLYEALDRLR